MFCLRLPRRKVLIDFFKTLKELKLGKSYNAFKRKKYFSTIDRFKDFSKMSLVVTNVGALYVIITNQSFIKSDTFTDLNCIKQIEGRQDASRAPYGRVELSYACKDKYYDIREGYCKPRHS